MSTRLNEDEREVVVDLLAAIYNRVAWSKMHGRYPHDVFNHRLRAATSTANLQHFVSRLCNYFGLQSLPVELAPIMAQLEPIEQVVLNTIRAEHIAYTMLTAIKAKEIREQRKAAKDAPLFNLERKEPEHEEV